MQGQRKPERCSRTGLALDTNFATLCFDNLTAEIKP